MRIPEALTCLPFKSSSFTAKTVAPSVKPKNMVCNRTEPLGTVLTQSQGTCPWIVVPSRTDTDPCERHQPQKPTLRQPQRRLQVKGPWFEMFSPPEYSRHKYTNQGWL